MKVVLLCGAQSNQVALACKVAARFELVGVVLEKRPPKKASSLGISQLLNKVLDRTLFSSIRHGWTGMLNYYEQKFPHLPKVPTITVANVNSDEAVAFIKQQAPDVLMVSGTRMLKDKILNLSIPKGIVNLHTGLSPYIKGGPNCTNWCLATNQIHLIGNTVMWIDAGIDSGDIITTETTPFTGNENLLQIHIAVMEHAHDLYLRSLEVIDKHFTETPHVKQSQIATGKTYYTKDWGTLQKWALTRTMASGAFKKQIISGGVERKKEGVKVVKLPA